VTASQIDLSFPPSWRAEILAARPLILPTRHFVYPKEVEEVERGALEVMIHPRAPNDPFLATCALGFRDPAVPTGIWSMPHPDSICAVAGGYAYIFDTSAPERFTMLPFRPVLQVLPAPGVNLLLFIGNRAILAWGAHGEAWQSPKLSDEGLSLREIRNGQLQGMGWNMITDRETPFLLDLRTGQLMKP